MKKAGGYPICYREDLEHIIQHQYCSKCGLSKILLIQSSKPQYLKHIETTDSIIYVFCCSNNNCICKLGSITVLKIQNSSYYNLPTKISKRIIRLNLKKIVLNQFFAANQLSTWKPSDYNTFKESNALKQFSVQNYHVSDGFLRYVPKLTLMENNSTIDSEKYVKHDIETNQKMISTFCKGNVETVIKSTSYIRIHDHQSFKKFNESKFSCTPPCLRCGAELKHNLQIMAPLIAQPDNSITILKINREKFSLPPKTWEWCTIKTYNCTENCNPRFTGLNSSEGQCVIKCE